MNGTVNKVILVGRLGADLDLRYTANGVAVTNLSIATDRVFTKSDGERVEETDWTRVVVWGKQAENCKSYLVKGQRVYVEGRLSNRSWEHEGTRHYRTEVVAKVVQFLDRPSRPKKDEHPPTYDDPMDELPF
jgi:single-strand DNA-binding protein